MTQKGTRSGCSKKLMSPGAAAVFLNQSTRLAKVGGWEFDVATGTSIWLDETYRMHQVPIGTPVSLELSVSFYIQEHREPVRRLLQKAIQTGKPAEGEFLKTTAKGKLFWVLLRVKPIVKNKKTVKLVGIVQDISKQKQAEIRREKSIRSNLQLVTEQVIKESELDRFVINYRLNERVAQLLAAAKTMTGLIGYHGQLNEQKLKETATILTIISKELNQLNSLLNVPQIKLIGLDEVLKEMVENLQIPGIRKMEYLNISNQLPKLDYDTQLMIYRIVEDHLKYMIKKLQPSNMDVKIDNDSQHILLNMTDDSDFDINSVSTDIEFQKMQGRLERHKGAVSVTAGKAGGCHISATIPLKSIKTITTR